MKWRPAPVIALLLLCVLTNCRKPIHTDRDLPPGVDRGVSLAGGARLVAVPNPICTAGNVGTTRLHWSAPGVTAIDVRVGGPDGTLLATGGGSGSTLTGEWVTDGMTFALRDVSAPQNPRVLATVAVRLVHRGC